MVQEYFSSDSVDIGVSDTSLQSSEDCRALQIMKETSELVDGHFQIGLLWKQTSPCLPESFEMAKSRLLGIEKRIERDESFGNRYRSEMEKYFTKGYAKELTDDMLIVNTPVWYLPHFGVVNAHKPEKLRIVFDAAATTNGVSLNSALLKGPE